MTVKIFWQPDGINLDQIGTKRLVDISDGDTPNIRMNVRMLSIDTPEKAPTGRIRRLTELDDEFALLADWIEGGTAPISPELAAHYAPRLRRPLAASAHVAQGRAATDAFEEVKDKRLRRPTGSVRSLFVRIADQPFDRYGRLLAYVAPDYNADERRQMSRADRATFNHLMTAAGWAAPFVIYPSIPGEWDLNFFRDGARRAVEAGRGAWADPLMLTGYEFRGLERLAHIHRLVRAGRRLSGSQLYAWIYRYCVDMTTGELLAPQDYIKARPYDRLFVWKEDVRQAVANLNLVPSDSFNRPPAG